MKTFTKFIIALAMLSLFSVANAQTIAGTAHDLTAPNGTYAGVAPPSIGKDLCRYCHAPHNNSETALTGSLPLWDRFDVVPGSFNLYGNPNGTMENTGMTLSGVSAACMSCHDGATAFDSIAQTAGSGVTMTTFRTGPTGVLGTELGNDHPINVDITVAQDMNAGGKTAIETAGLKLFGNDVECGSCHDVHDNSNTYFLRMAPGGADLCSTCHVK